MTNQLKNFIKSAIHCLAKSGVDEPIKVLSPFIQSIYHSQYNRLVGHLNTCLNYQISYSNESGGYNDGTMKVIFLYPSSRPKLYEFKFTSVLKGDYTAPEGSNKAEFWCPTVSVTITEDVGKEVFWKGSENDFLQFKEKLKKELTNEEEINRLRHEIAEKQRLLAAMSKAS